MSYIPSRPTVLSPDEAAELIRDGSTLLVSGLVGSLVPNATLAAVRRRFDRDGAPTSLTVLFPVAVGDVFEAPGVDLLAHPRLISRVIGGSFVYGRRPDTGAEPDLTRLIFEEEVDAYNFPIGVMFGAIRESSAGRPGLITKVGLGTFHDPRNRGGRLNNRTPPAFVGVVDFDGNEFLRYQLPTPDVALLRGTTADEYGNITVEQEVAIGGVLQHAIATHSAGGRVIAQVQRLAEGGSLDPKRVAVPGVLIDAVVVVPGEQQATAMAYDPYLSGELRRPAGIELEAEMKPVERVILAKAASRLSPGDLVILGFGIPSKLPLLDGMPEGLRFTVEHGAIGGIPAGGLQFGGAFNAEAIIPTPNQFDLIDGGGCDVACLGFAEADASGSVNVSRLPHSLPGSGGFTNITSATRKLIFCGTLTAGGLEVAVDETSVRVTREGRFRKFVEQPRELTFRAGLRVDQEVSFVTDRCVIERRGEGLVVTEVYPGIDVERDVLGQVEVRLGVELA